MSNYIDLLRFLILALVLIAMQVPLEYQQPEWLCCCPTASVEPGTSHQVKPLLIHLFSHLTSARIFVPCPWWSLTRDVSRKSCPCKEPMVLIFLQAHHVPPTQSETHRRGTSTVWGLRNDHLFFFCAKIYNKDLPLTVVPFICLFKWQAHIIDIPLISIDKQLHIILKSHWLHNTAECTTWSATFWNAQWGASSGGCRSAESW